MWSKRCSFIHQCHVVTSAKQNKSNHPDTCNFQFLGKNYPTLFNAHYLELKLIRIAAFSRCSDTLAAISLNLSGAPMNRRPRLQQFKILLISSHIRLLPKRDRRQQSSISLFLTYPNEHAHFARSSYAAKDSPRHSCRQSSCWRNPRH